MTKLITGGTGFIGAQLARHLVDSGEDVVLFDINPDARRIRDIESRVNLVRGDLAQWPDVFQAVKQNRVDAIYHVGAMLSLPSEDRPWTSFQANVMGTMHVLEAARLLGLAQVVFASTGDTYGLAIKGIVTDETIQRPLNAYGCAKLTGEVFGRYYARKYRLDFRSVRICAAVVGPGVKTWAPSQYVSWMIEAAALGKPFECFVGPDVRLPIVYYKDIARAFEKCAAAPREKTQTLCYNVTGIAPSPSARQLEAAIKRRLPGAQISYKPDARITGILKEQAKIRFDDQRARIEWGWKPKYGTIGRIIEDFIKEVRASE